MSNFRQVDRQTGFLLPPSVDEWLPERHLARFVVEVIEGLDLRAFIGSYRGSGSASYHPEMLLGLLVYGYATGVFSSRKLERATYDSVAFRFINKPFTAVYKINSDNGEPIQGKNCENGIEITETLNPITEVTLTIDGRSFIFMPLPAIPTGEGAISSGTGFSGGLNIFINYFLLNFEGILM
jgi:Transposase domain (DUF772)